VSEHIVSPKIYAAILIALLFFTLLTVGAALEDFGPWNIVIALAIATVKASLVVLFFMHARYVKGRTQLVIVAGFFWLAIMLSLTLVDYTTRHQEPSTSQRFTPVTLLTRS
jgi:cytochrome c oxidase subunit 4